MKRNRSPLAFSSLLGSSQASTRANCLGEFGSRRNFLRQAATAFGALTVIPGAVLGRGGQTSPNQRFNLAGVGVGGVGFGQLQECEKAGFQLVALFDQHVGDLAADLEG